MPEWPTMNRLDKLRKHSCKIVKELFPKGYEVGSIAATDRWHVKLELCFEGPPKIVEMVYFQSDKLDDIKHIFERFKVKLAMIKWESNSTPENIDYSSLMMGGWEGSD